LAEIFTGAWQQKVAHTIHQLCRSGRSKKIKKNREDNLNKSVSVLANFR
jgi:hypothetical protein